MRQCCRLRLRLRLRQESGGDVDHHAALRPGPGLSPQLLLGLMPSSYAYFFFAFYPSDLAAINMDRSGTTRIGKYLLNHSFMIPGWIGVIVSPVVAYGLVQVYF